MPDISTAILIAAATLLIAVGLYRGYRAAKREEPKALGVLALAAFHAAEREVAEKQVAANLALAEAQAAAAQLTQLRAQVSGAPVTPVA